MKVETLRGGVQSAMPCVTGVRRRAYCLIMLVMFTPPAVTFWLVSKRWV